MANICQPTLNIIPTNYPIIGSFVSAITNCSLQPQAEIIKIKNLIGLRNFYVVWCFGADTRILETISNKPAE